MHISQLILHRSKRLQLLSDETFTYTATDRHTVIRGTSGYGKSSILYELSPLPAHMRDFFEGGYKEIHLTHQGKSFILKSEGKGAGKHSFLLDGVELNQGKTISVQYQLVEQYFNYTKAIHEIMVGINRFTKMSMNERRDWFNKLSQTDDVFIRSLWDKIRGGKRDAQGALKNTKQKITEHTSTLFSEEDLRLQKTMLEEFKTARNQLVNLRGQRADNNAKEALTAVSDRLFSLYPTYEEKTEQLHKALLQYAREVIDIPPEDISNHLAILSHDIERLKKEHTSLLEQLEVCQEKEKAYQVDPDTALQIQSLEEQCGRDYAAFNNQPDAEYIKQLKQAFCKHPYKMDDLIRLYSQLKESMVRSLTYYRDVATIPLHEAAIQHRDNTKLVSELSRKIGVYTSAIEEAKNHLKQLEQEPDHVCPKCEHRFKDNNADEKLIKLRERIQSLSISLTETEKQHEDARRAYDSYQCRYDSYQSLKEHLFFTQPLGLIFAEMTKIKTGLQDSAEFGKYLDSHAHEVLNWWIELEKVLHRVNQYNQIMDKCVLLEELKQRQLSASSPEHIQLIQQITTLTSNAESVDVELQAVEKQHRKYQQAKQLIIKINTLYADMDALFDKLFSLYDNALVKTYHGTVDEMLSILTEKIDSLEKIVQEQRGIEHVIGYLTQTEKDLEADIHDHDVLMKILNPKDGLMAKSILGFIQFFTQEMNNLIHQVWTYPLVITLDDQGEFLKDYKFPVSVDGEMTPDVFYTSMGQSEMIDLAFKLVMAKHLKLDGWCIYADELGSNLNPRFRYGLYSLLKRLLDEGRFNQLFVITHLADVAEVMSTGQEIDLD